MASQYIQYEVGDTVPFHFIPGIVVASYFVSLVGAVTTVELLHRRTPGKGWISRLQLAACSICMGLVAIWCMHYIGNRAIEMGDGNPEIQIYYSPGYTALSAVIPILVLSMAFLVADWKTQNQKSLFYLILVGIFAGGAIACMHYSANFGIINYSLYFPGKYIGGAVAIAISACMAALTLFFLQQEYWINVWWRRWVCALTIAGAVTGMHFTASVGTTYTIIHVVTEGSNERNTNVIIATVLSFSASVIIVAMVLGTLRRRKQLYDRAQQAVLACATFDPDGKLMVTQEGLVPCRKITKQFNTRSFDEEFNMAHPVFLWIYRVTRNWSCVSELVDSMRKHLAAASGSKNPAKLGKPLPSDDASSWTDSEGEQDYSVVFRESFVIAAQALADQIKEPLENIGMLYDQILTTGALDPDISRKKRVLSVARRIPTPGWEDVEGRPYGNHYIFGKGQLLFLVRQATKADAVRLTNAGHRFAHVNQVAEILSKGMQVPQKELTVHMDRLRLYGRDDDYPTTSYLAFFGLHPTIPKGTWQILVEREDLSKLPMVPLPSEDFVEKWNDMLPMLEGMSVMQCMSLLTEKIAKGGDREREFSEGFSQSILKLSHLISEQFFRLSALSTKSVRVPYYKPGLGAPAYMNMLVFCCIPDVHASQLQADSSLHYIPFSFYKIMHRVYKNSPDHAVFAREVHREFSSIVGMPDVLISTNTQSSRQSMLGMNGETNHAANRGGALRRYWPFANLLVGPGRSKGPRRSSSDQESIAANAMPANPWGGIKVDTEVTVMTSEENGHVALKELGTMGTASVATGEGSTFVDDLYKLTVARWQRH